MLERLAASRSRCSSGEASTRLAMSSRATMRPLVSVSNSAASIRSPVLAMACASS